MSSFWTPDEDAIILNRAEGEPWALTRTRLPGRTAKACISRRAKLLGKSSATPLRGSNVTPLRGDDHQHAAREGTRKLGAAVEALLTKMRRAA